MAGKKREKEKRGGRRGKESLFFSSQLPLPLSSPPFTSKTRAVVARNGLFNDPRRNRPGEEGGGGNWVNSC